MTILTLDTIKRELLKRGMTMIRQNEQWEIRNSAGLVVAFKLLSQVAAYVRELMQ